MNNHLRLLNIKRTTTYDIGGPCPSLEQARECGGAKSVKGIATLSLPLKKTTYYHKNECKHKHGQSNNRIIECSLLTVYEGKICWLKCLVSEIEEAC